MKVSGRWIGRFFVSIVLGLMLSSCRFFPSIPVLSLDKDGNETRDFIPEKRFVGKYGEVINETKSLTVNKLESYEGQSQWELSTVALGLGLNAEVGIGPISWETVPSFEIRLQKL